MAKLNIFFKFLILLIVINCLKKWKNELLIQMNKGLYKKFHISLYISIYGFQNLLPLYQWHPLLFM
jgi:hypothetical protein